MFVEFLGSTNSEDLNIPETKPVNFEFNCSSSGDFEHTFQSNQSINQSINQFGKVLIHENAMCHKDLASQHLHRLKLYCYLFLKYFHSLLQMEARK